MSDGVVINSVIWSDRKWNKGVGQRAVGIAEELLQGDGFITVDIAEKSKKNGDLYYPSPMRILKSRALTYGIDYRKKVKLRIVPISAMQPIS